MTATGERARRYKVGLGFGRGAQGTLPAKPDKPSKKTPGAGSSGSGGTLPPDTKERPMWWTETLIYFLKAYAIFFAGMFTGIFVMALMHAAKRSDEEADRDFRVGFRDKL